MSRLWVWRTVLVAHPGRRGRVPVVEHPAHGRDEGASSRVVDLFGEGLELGFGLDERAPDRARRPVLASGACVRCSGSPRRRPAAPGSTRSADGSIPACSLPVIDDETITSGMGTGMGNPHPKRR